MGECAAQAIPGVDAVGVTLAHPSEARSRIRVWAVTADFVRHIDSVQYDVHDEGPGITSLRTGRPCVSGAIHHDRRWPRFGPAAAHLGVQSALSVPLMIGEEAIGAICAYATNPDAFAEHAMMLGTRFAGPAAVAVHNARLLLEAQHQADQLQRRLTYRSTIDQAVGIIRGRSGASAEDALGRLVNLSRSTNTKLNVTAERLIDDSVRHATAHRDP
nr:GAF and ANTAR domain-containing protein [Mycobacterium sp. Z3061]